MCRHAEPASRPRRQSLPRVPWRDILTHVAVTACALSSPIGPAGAQADAPCGSVDLVLAIDESGSMAWAIDDLKARIAELLDVTEQASGGAYRLGLVTFAKGVTVRADLDAKPDPHTKRAAVDGAVQTLSVKGGGNNPEASDEALNTILNRLHARGRLQTGDFRGEFRSETRILVLVTDQLPAGFDDVFTEGVDDESVLGLAAQAARMGVRISTITVPPRLPNDTLWPRLGVLMAAIARTSGGVPIVVSPFGRGAAEEIMDIVRACGAVTVSMGGGPDGPPAPITPPPGGCSGSSRTGCSGRSGA